MQLKELYFSPKGRINRQKFFWGGICTGIVGYIIPAILMGLGTLIDMEEIFAFISVCMYVIFIYSTIILHIKRWHDLDRPGWYCLLCCIPIVGLIAGIYLLFVKGSDGRNNFGEDPLK